MCNTGDAYCGDPYCPRCSAWMPPGYDPPEQPHHSHDDYSGPEWCDQDDYGTPFDPKTDFDNLPF